MREPKIEFHVIRQDQGGQKYVDRPYADFQQAQREIVRLSQGDGGLKASVGVMVAGNWITEPEVVQTIGHMQGGARTWTNPADLRYLYKLLAYYRHQKAAVTVEQLLRQNHQQVPIAASRRHRVTSAILRKQHE